MERYSWNLSSSLTANEQLMNFDEQNRQPCRFSPSPAVLSIAHIFATYGKSESSKEILEGSEPSKGEAPSQGTPKTMVFSPLKPGASAK
jgi:hypothetical protein